MENNSFKIALISDNGKTIGNHFGPAKNYLVITIEDGKETGRENREKYSPHAAGQGHHHEHNHENGHSHGSGGHGEKHSRMLENITDCKYLLARGMGRGIFGHLESAGITPILTTIRDIDEAVQAVIDGTIENHTEKLH